MYCAEADLLVGDMPVNPASAAGFIQAATDEIDSALGVNYALPIDLTAADATVELYLKRVAALLATGRLILAQSVGSEDQSTHAYGRYLLEEGKMLLREISTGDMVLYGVPRRDEFLTAGNGPSIQQEDQFSPIDAFYSYAMRGNANAYFRPGDLND